ncbi:FkbM family methyltransferase [Chitinophaga sp. CF418]|uniref:FkbM family methyltransferase n=1 Tax=Chitinophaga sp. CF418 TaxID=1855287 RepID=UPI000913D20F|nr:FkbM family methyltransferase [Chitinophaga sp. CF418]SHL96074.1 methyltransferase, FkbM family [Chitinophaga sp. CF418]
MFFRYYRFKADTDAPYIIDCGANIGLSILYFKWLYPKAKVLAFEPDGDNLVILQKNVESYGMNDINVQQQVVLRAPDQNDQIKKIPDECPGSLSKTISINYGLLFMLLIFRICCSLESSLK